MQADQDNNIFKGLVEQGITVKEFRNKERKKKIITIYNNFTWGEPDDMDEEGYDMNENDMYITLDDLCRGLVKKLHIYEV